MPLPNIDRFDASVKSFKGSIRDDATVVTVYHVDGTEKTVRPLPNATRGLDTDVIKEFDWGSPQISFGPQLRLAEAIIDTLLTGPVDPMAVDYVAEWLSSLRFNDPDSATLRPRTEFWTKPASQLVDLICSAEAEHVKQKTAMFRQELQSEAAKLNARAVEIEQRQTTIGAMGNVVSAGYFSARLSKDYAEIVARLAPIQEALDRMGNDVSKFRLTQAAVEWLEQNSE